MASLNLIFQSRKFTLFLNISFLFLLLIGIITSVSHHHTIPTVYSSSVTRLETNGPDCSGLHDFTDYRTQCLYVKSHVGCKPKGYINYLKIFYCTCGQFPFLGYSVISLWLVILFYVLGNTAANYFCSSLESLSEVLKLPPTIAGVTLLSLGNGAPDVFSSIVSFTKSGDGDVGFNSILGGALVTSTIVVGVIGMIISPKEISLDKNSFIRDVVFFLFCLLALLLIILVGKINLWGSISFVSIYLVYVSLVSLSYFFEKKKEKKTNIHSTSMAAAKSFFDEYNDDEMGIPLLGYIDDEKPKKNQNDEDGNQGQNLIIRVFNQDSSFGNCISRVLNLLELPLYLPRRLTIPVVSEENWSKPYAVISVTLAPFLLATIYNTQIEETQTIVYIAAGLSGISLGGLAYVATDKTSPPQRHLLPWLVGGFLMSVTWTYLIAEELVSLLVSFGHIVGVSPSILGLTVLAWGNSVGDFTANFTVAMNGGPDGAQIAITGCYAGPMFNTLMGLGLSLVCSSYYDYPASYLIPIDNSLYETLGFLIGSLLWGLVILPRKNMKMDRFLGCGLLAIYFCFLFLRLARAFGLLNNVG